MSVLLHFLVPSVAVQGVHDGLDRALLSGDASVLSVFPAHDHERHAPKLLFDFVLSVAVQVCEEVLDASWKRIHNALFQPFFDSLPDTWTTHTEECVCECACECARHAQYQHHRQY